MTVSLLIEVPEALQESLKTFLELRPDFNQDRVFTAALSLFLLQNRAEDMGCDRQSERLASRFYLDALFKSEVQP